MEQNLTQEEKKTVETTVPTITSNPTVKEETKEEPTAHLPEIIANPAVIISKEPVLSLCDNIPDGLSTTST